MEDNFEIFETEELNKIMIDNQDRLNERVKKLDCISKDIKKMEIVLHNCGISNKESTNKNGTSVLYENGKIFILLANTDGSSQYKRFIECKSDIRLHYWPDIIDFFKEIICNKVVV